MAEKIGTIREKLQAAAIEELPALFSEYADDERAGVQAEITKAKKRIAAYMPPIRISAALTRWEEARLQVRWWRER